jgi:hypothetical protein
MSRAARARVAPSRWIYPELESHQRLRCVPTRQNTFLQEVFASV